MRIKTNCSLEAGPGSSSAWYLTKAFSELGHDIVTGHEADLVVNVDGMPHVDRLPGAKYFFWDTDSFMHEPNESTLAFDKVFIGGSPKDLERYPEGTVFLPHAFDPAYHFYCNVPKEFDLVFIGRTDNIYSKRNNLMRDLSARYKMFIASAEPGIDYSYQMSKGRVIFNMSLADNIPMRFFEARAIGCLVQNRVTGIDDYCIDGEDCFIYDEDNPLYDVIDNLLANPKMIERVSKKSRKEVFAKHTYKHRAKEILSYV